MPSSLKNDEGTLQLEFDKSHSYSLHHRVHRNSIYNTVVAAFQLAIDECKEAILVSAVIPLSLDSNQSRNISPGIRRIIDSLECPKEYPPTTPELLAEKGYESESHVVVTPDGFYLGLHRVLYHSDALYARSLADLNDAELGGGSLGDDPVLFLHGCMFSSESFVCRDRAEDSLALQLSDRGYDVWLANRRGNRYSQLHQRHHWSSREFWNHSVDEGICLDLPAMVEYILEVTGHPKITLVGFSQGTTEALAALSTNPRLADCVRCVVALSAAGKPNHSTSPLVQFLYRNDPDWWGRLLLGWKSLSSSMPDVLRWSPPCLMILMSEAFCKLMFSTHHGRIAEEEKPRLYRHLYSMASTKQVIHYAQMISSGHSQMFRHCPHGPAATTYPLHTIKTPILVILGTDDQVSDGGHLLRQLPPDNTLVVRVPGHDHLDTIWARDVHQSCNVHAIDFIDAHNPAIVSKIDFD